MSSPASYRCPSSPRSPPCLKWHTVRLMRFARIRDLRALQAQFVDQLRRDLIAALVKAVSPTSRYLSRGEPGATAPNTIANTTRRSNRTLECTSATFGMCDGVSTNVASVVMKTKYVAARSMKRSTTTRTRPSSLFLTATPHTTMSITLRGPQLSLGRSKHSSGLVVLKSWGSSPMKEE